jgi:glucose/arabinose dehydrogenase
MTDRKAALAGQLARLAPQEQVATAAPMPAEQDKPDRWPARISMTASPEMKRALDLARLDDGIEVTARIRAMITLWQEDRRLRARVDKLARTLR